MPDRPIAYFISFTTYGSWLHGRSNGSVDSEHNEFGTLFLTPNPEREREAREAMKQPPYPLDWPRRQIVLATIQEVCRHRGWSLLACHVRETHVHTIVSATGPPEKAMNDLKAYASRRLNEAGFENKDRKRWTRHGSTRYVWDEKYLHNAVNYVLNRQGEPMELCCTPEFDKLLPVVLNSGAG